MKPIKFKEQTTTLLGRCGMGVKPLPIYTDGTVCISCWKLSFVEKIKAVLFGRVWLRVRSGKTQPPVSMICSKLAFEEEIKK